MRKTKNILVAVLALVVLALPMFVSGCFGSKTEPKLEIQHEFKTEYLVGETINLDGGVLKHTNKNGEEKLVNITEQMIFGFTTATVGNRELSIEYQGLNIKIAYTVSVLELMDNAIYYFCTSTINTSFFIVDKATHNVYMSGINTPDITLADVKTALNNWKNNQPSVIEFYELPYIQNVVNGKAVITFTQYFDSGSTTSYIVEAGEDQNTALMTAAGYEDKIVFYRYIEQ